MATYHANVNSFGRTRNWRGTASRADLADWRRLTRPLILADFLDRTRDLSWSRELVDQLLDELHVWARRDGTGQSVTFPARQFTANGQRRSFSLLRA